MSELSFLHNQHNQTGRDYLGRVTAHDKAQCAEIAKRFDAEYWDGERHHGYGGYHYDGRWRPMAEALATHYKLQQGMRVLDVGCGKGFLLYELTQAVPGLIVQGIDISAYAIATAKEEVRPFLTEGHARSLPFDDGAFDLVISLMTLHNLILPDLWSALKEIERVGKGHGFIAVETYKTERQKMNLLYWQLTCRAFFMPREWLWIFQNAGYRGDWEFLTFD